MTPIFLVAITRPHLIEREKSRVLKNGSIFVPAQWAGIIQSAKKTGKPYQVYELDYTDVIDLKELTKSFGKNFTTNTDGEKVVWNDIRKFYMQSTNPERIFYLYSYDDAETMKQIDVRQRMRSNTAIPMNPNLPKKFCRKPEISLAKKRDLISLCDANVIPSVHHEYYKNIDAGNEIRDGETDIEENA